MKQSENCKHPSAPPPPFFTENVHSLYQLYDMPIPRYIATLALMPKSALNKYWRYIEGALYNTLTLLYYTNVLCLLQ